MLSPESKSWICLGKCAHWLLEIQDSRNRLSEWGVLCKVQHLATAVARDISKHKTPDIRGFAQAHTEVRWVSNFSVGPTQPHLVAYQQHYLAPAAHAASGAHRAGLHRGQH